MATVQEFKAAFTGPSRRLVRAGTALLASWALLGVRRIALQPSGLRAQYFTTTNWTGAPDHSGIVRAIATEEIAKGWKYQLPGAFSIQWSGWLFVDRAGDYTFKVTSD